MLKCYNVKLFTTGCLYCIVTIIACYMIKTHDGLLRFNVYQKQEYKKGQNYNASQNNMNQNTSFQNNRKAKSLEIIGQYFIRDNELNAYIDIIDNTTSVQQNGTQVCFTLDNVVDDRVFWSKEVEKLIPTGLSDDDVDVYFKTIDKGVITKADNAREHVCSNVSPHNKHVEISNHTAMCARMKRWKCIESEIFAYHLSRILNMDNVPPAKLTIYHRDFALWSEFPSLSGWKQGNIVSLSKWINDLGDGPPLPGDLLHRLDHTHQPLTYKSMLLKKMCHTQLMEMAQISDLLLFDFIIGHGDRLVRNKIKEMSSKRLKAKGIVPRDMKSNIKNLNIDQVTHKMWFIDNELSFGITRAKERSVINLNEDAMKTLCIFRKSTIEAVDYLVKSGNPCEELFDIIKTKDPLFWTLFYKKRRDVFVEYLNQLLITNLKKVLIWFEHCKNIQ